MLSTSRVRGHVQRAVVGATRLAEFRGRRSRLRRRLLGAVLPCLAIASISGCSIGSGSAKQPVATSVGSTPTHASSDPTASAARDFSPDVRTGAGFTQADNTLLDQGRSLCQSWAPSDTVSGVIERMSRSGTDQDRTRAEALVTAAVRTLCPAYAPHRPGLPAAGSIPSPWLKIGQWYRYPDGTSLRATKVTRHNEPAKTLAASSWSWR